MAGWNRPSANQPATKKGGVKAPSMMKGIIVGAVAVVVGVVCIFAFSNGEADSRPLQKGRSSGRIKEVTPAPAPKAVEEPKEEKKVNTAKLELAKRLKAMTPEERVDFIFAEAAKRPIDLTPTTNQPFKTAIELQMARIFTTQLGNMPPPLMPIALKDEAHLAEILIANNPAIEGDSEKIKEAKEMVELAKKELKDYIKQGGEVRDFITYYYGKLDEAFREHRMAQTELLKSAKENPDIAQEYCDKINERLTEKGIKPVELPEKFKQRWNIP